jgi:hypothetical protein
MPQKAKAGVSPMCTQCKTQKLSSGDLFCELTCRKRQCDGVHVAVVILFVCWVLSLCLSVSLSLCDVTPGTNINLLR